MSESQERMMAIVAPGKVDEFAAVCAKWDVEATVIGEVTGDGLLTMTWRGGTVVSIPPETAADGPVYNRPLARPAGQDELAANSSRQHSMSSFSMNGSPTCTLGRFAAARPSSASPANVADASTDAPPTPSGPVREPNSTTLFPGPLATAAFRSACRIAPTHSALTSGLPA